MPGGLGGLLRQQYAESIHEPIKYIPFIDKNINHNNIIFPEIQNNINYIDKIKIIKKLYIDVVSFFFMIWKKIYIIKF
jgi:hypothetical protein